MNGLSNGHSNYEHKKTAEISSFEVHKKVFNDAIHGTIEVHPLCVKIIDTPQFQRLRLIKQIGPCYFVYPSAAHNRFEHCLGVSHLAGQLVSALRHRQKELSISEIDVLCLEVAGLCHDLGHGPFSHLFDKFIERVRPGTSWRHEDNSIAMLDHLIEVNDLRGEFTKYGLTERDITFIKEVISIKGPFDTNNWHFKGRPVEKRFLYEIVANKTSGIDVDKWDYFLRDGHGLGVQVNFDYKRLMQFSRVIDNQICYRDKEELNIKNMFTTRESLHRIAYQHKVAKILDAMVLDALTLADRHIKYRSHHGKLIAINEVIDDPFAMTHLNDDVLNRIYSSDSQHQDMIKAKDIIHRIFTRRLYPYIGYAGPVNNVTTRDLLSAIISNLKITESSLTEEDLDIQVKAFDHGAGKQNPLNKVRFFTKTDHWTSDILLPRQTSNMYPVVFQEHFYQVICKKDEPNLLDEAKLAFQRACDGLKINFSLNAEPNKFTPEKKKPLEEQHLIQPNQLKSVRNLEKNGLLHM